MHVRQRIRPTVYAGGLDLSSGTPYLIAHSIVAEVLAVKTTVTRVTKKWEEPIHNRVMISRDVS